MRAESGGTELENKKKSDWWVLGERKIKDFCGLLAGEGKKAGGM